MNITKIFATKLKELRTEKHVSQAKLSAELNITQPVISQWENATRTISIYDLVKLADYFGVTTDYLLGRED